MLRGKVRDEALGALDALSRSLLRLPRQGFDASLSRGEAGFAIAHSALAGVFPDRPHARRAESLLGSAARRLATDPMSPSFMSGFPGIAWAVELLAGDPGATPEEDVNAEVDEALDGYLRVRGVRGMWRGPYDLVDGLVGLGVYALERIARPSAVTILELVIGHLAAMAEDQSPGVAWRSRPEWSAATSSTSALRWNLGVAHGVPGVIALLGYAVAAKVGARQARQLLDGAVTWLLAQELSPGSGGRFSNARARRGSRALPARLAWCYGDPGVAVALLVAARAAREPAWERAALRIALAAAARAEDDSGVVDAGLCHGAAGLGHLFHRLYLATRERRLSAASVAWLTRAVRMRTKKGGFAGYFSYTLGPEGKMTWSASPAFLEGCAGTALALSAAVKPSLDLGWDRAFLLPGRAGWP
jgi:hypothetical protein